MKVAFILIVIHFLADFVCQSNAMAQGKSKSNIWLTKHILAYQIVFIIPSIYLLGFEYGMIYVGINGFLHWITDYFTSRWTSRLWEKKDVHNFFVVIGFDQVIHYACLFGTYHYFNLLL